MRKCIVLLSIFFIFTNCEKESGVIEIKEKMFIGQVNDIYINSASYLGKTIKIEGIFMIGEDDDGQDPFYAVFRYGPGCCGNDGIVGFEVAWSDEKRQPFPRNDSWVEAIGELKEYTYGNYQNLFIDLSSMIVMDKRGKETVTQ